MHLAQLDRASIHGLFVVVVISQHRVLLSHGLAGHLACHTRKTRKLTTSLALQLKLNILSGGISWSEIWISRCLVLNWW